MNKIITVWGSPGSGKSTFCCILAKALTKEKEKAIIISTDANVPMLPVWLPNQEAEKEVSIGHLLHSEEIDPAAAAGHVTVLKSYPFIGLMGFTAGENPFSYLEIKYHSAQKIIHAASKLVDYVICDCCSSSAVLFTFAAIEEANTVVRLITPDYKGLNYLRAYQPLLTDTRYKFESHISLSGLARPFHAIDEIGRLAGGFDGLLPYSKEIHRCTIEFDMFQANKYCHPKYMDSLEKVLHSINTKK